MPRPEISEPLLPEGCPLAAAAVDGDGAIRQVNDAWKELARAGEYSALSDAVGRPIHEVLAALPGSCCPLSSPGAFGEGPDLNRPIAFACRPGEANVLVLWLDRCAGAAQMVVLIPVDAATAGASELAALTPLQIRQREQRRLADMLHDVLAQKLALIKMQLQLLAQGLGPAEQQQLLATLQLVNESINDARELAVDMLPLASALHGLVPALRDICSKLQREWRLRITFESESEHVPVPLDATLLLLRACRELLHNVVRHSRARSARVRLRCSEQQLRIMIDDPGLGVSRPLALKDMGYGLSSASHDLSVLGGSLHVYPRPRGGTRGDIRLPVTEIQKEVQ